jgi:hypothetical protein
MSTVVEIRSRCCAAPVHSMQARDDRDGEYREFIVTASGHLSLGEPMSFVCEDCECYCETVELRRQPADATADSLYF